MKTKTIHTATHAKVLQHTYTKGIDIGDYFFVVTDKQGQFLEKFSNREGQAAIQFANRCQPVAH